MLENPRPASWVATFIKRFIYSQLAVLDGFMIAIGRRKPKLEFSILGDPSSVYINFTVRPDMADEFAAYINLAEGLTLTPIACVEGEEAVLTLTLNIYEVSGLVSGARAEWSTYITDPEGCPRYLVLEAQSNKGSMDPVNLVTRAGKVEHACLGSSLDSEITALDGKTFISKLHLDDAQPAVRAQPEWIAANDKIYWRNGVYDRAWYNGDMFNATIRSIPPRDANIHDETHWSRFVEPDPRHVLRYEGEMVLVVSPWYNV